MPRRRIAAVLSAALLLLFWGLVLSVFASDLRYSHVIDKSAGEILADASSDCAAAPAGVFAPDSSSFSCSLLNGASLLGKLTISADGSASISAAFGKCRVLLVSTLTGQILRDWSPRSTDSPVQLSPGEYQVYLVGRWFSGKLLFSHPGGSFRAA